MASLKMLDAAAAQAGFVHADCVHEAARTHLVYDYPDVFRDGSAGPFWRVHTDMARVPHVTHITGTDTPEQRVSLVNAIDFMQRVARQNPK
jgi:predicted phosphohydrolase